MQNKEKNVKEIITVLMQLDEESLLLIDSGAKLLAARQDLEKKTYGNVPKQPA